MSSKDLAKASTIAVIGECMLELSLPVALANTASKQSSALGDLNCSLAFGGDTLNTAVYLARMGVDTHYVSALGQDAYSDWMISQWQSEHVRCELVDRVENALPGLYAIETDRSGERSFSYWRDQAPVRRMLSNKEKREKLFSKLQDMDLIYFSGISLSLFPEPDREALFEFLEAFSKVGGLIAFDSNYRPRQWPDIDKARRCFARAYSLSDIALSTLDDEQLLYPAVCEAEVIDRLIALGIKEIVLKKGPQGSVLVSAEERMACPANFVEQARDTTAAGDSFNAAYLASRIRGQSQLTAAKNGHRLAASVVQQHGAIIDKNSMPNVWEADE
ncbi:sugar kinase [uncultured Pseudoteredinibacter sp.]|uniref:sugar kinase n=1 Tax=uncultured Pseudoteredinibacter sp. TaxID=1641701 RepID=UPI002625B76A|nr:sugar kinase [uncultured Pseudoteredinibacter sp.]